MTRQQALANAGKHAAGALHWIRSMPIRIRIAVKDWREAKTEEQTATALPSLEARQAQLLSFYESYESLVELLCDAAQYGPSAKLETDYERLRTWMMANYGAIRPYVVAYLRLDPVDAQPGLDLHGQASDGFEALFAATTLEQGLRNDDGHMIERILRTREALSRYADHLRLLIAQQ